MSAAFIKKDISGYKTLYDGVGEDISIVLKKFDMTHSYFPAVRGTALPIYFGIIGDPNINQVKIIEEKRSIEEQAKIIDAGGRRIWLVYMNKFEGSDFKIVGLSNDGKRQRK